MGLPVSVEITIAASSVRAIIASAARCSASARPKPPMVESCFSALAAASSASAVSSGVAEGASPIGFSVTGEITASVAAPRLQLPSMKRPNRSYMVHPISLVRTVRPWTADRIAASARRRARLPSSKPTSGVVPVSIASTKAEISAAKASA
jgi:hypothetical protein